MGLACDLSDKFEVCVVVQDGKAVGISQGRDESVHE